ncbi:enolase C-terminal domain-like protein [Glaciibacter superstes]|uniref:enolase C-terminal domain-like protein n=1 Tax=Glaciibacter superstes TaxID=501023 RepID=UPI0003B47DE3|nr:enolase C-terminal domain-like protein [Glaciibacter superstes]
MSIVSQVRVTPIAVPDPPLLNTWGVHEPWALRIIVEVFTDDGVVGLGEAQGGEAAAQLLNRAASAILGADIRDASTLEQLVRSALPGSGERAVLTAFSPLEVACLDAHGQLDGLSCAELLGGVVREQVDFSGYLFYKWAEHPATAQRPPIPDEWGAVMDTATLVSAAAKLVHQYGFRSLKLKGGVFAPEVEIEAIRALRTAFPDHRLRLDPNCAWTLETAREASNALAGTLEYLEDPIGCDGMAGLAQSQMPLATNMCVAETAQIEPALADGAFSILLADHHYWGGLRRTVALAEHCRRIGWGVSLHSNSHLGISLAAMTQLGSAIPNLGYAGDTHYPWSAAHDIIEPGAIAIENGATTLPTAPGLGVRLNRDSLAAAHEEYLRCGIRTRNDTAYMQSVHPDFDPGLPRW